MRLNRIALCVGLLASPFGFALELQTVTITAGEGQGWYEATGTLQAVKSAQLSVPVAGRITQLPAQVNAQVKAGQLLAQIDGAPAEQAANASRAQIAAAEAGLAQAKSEFARAKALADKQYLSASAFEKAQAQYRIAEAQAKAQMAQAGAATAQAALFRLTAPFAGVVARVNGDLGAVTMPSQPIVELYDPAALRVEVQLPATAIESLKRDISPQVTLAGRKLPVEDVQWFPTTDLQAQSRTVRIQLRPGVKATPGNSAQVLFSTVSKGQMVVPSTSVLRFTEFSAVYILTQDGTPQMRYIRTGKVLGAQTEVLSGLRRGDKLVLNPAAAQSMAGGVTK
ncbi:efflux RND transporter periplasmic adaptor subunit [uncultured Aquitalea sp.]|uniref:efflux RND transporter periplasmic adaptor subunit n=1 Tax=uncultured Aquitalea sp. TaxID=540272 RepID=UPI0025FD7259|nr:efflux RND transporter periplasmic adaptor subunit [uncultured Aquitalea sp.]